MNDVEGKKLLIHKIMGVWSNDRLLIKGDERRAGPRPGIVSRLLARLITDDSRVEVFGLPKGCGIRELARTQCAKKLTCGE